jgi:NADP-dependent 3-hydroxy acid dehydrogenase YdfG
MSRTAIVTGASSGIGEATARELAEVGLDLALAARREERLAAIVDDLEAEYGVEAVAVPTDVRDEAAVDALVEATVERFGRLDVLVNNAGVGRGSDVAELETEQYRTMTETNQDGVFFATRAALPHLLDAEGHLIFVGSFAGQFPRPFNPVYAASKWWVRGFAHSVAAQVGGRASGASATSGDERSESAGDEGLAVTVVNPSEVRTEFDTTDGSTFAETFEPGTVTEPEEVAEAIRFAATRERSGVSEIDLYRRDKFADSIR